MTILGDHPLAQAPAGNNIGEHLLGWRKSTPDEKDWSLDDYVADMRALGVRRLTPDEINAAIGGALADGIREGIEHPADGVIRNTTLGGTTASGSHPMLLEQAEADDVAHARVAAASGIQDLGALADAVLDQRHTREVKAWVRGITDAVVALQGTTPEPPAPPEPAPPAPPEPAPTPEPDPQPVTVRAWPNNELRDQGQTGHCVGFSGINWGNTIGTDGVDDYFTNDDGHTLYYECKVKDGEPEQENGSTVRSLMQALQDRGRVTNYASARSIASIAEFVLNLGPVCVGTPWYEGMFNPDALGILHLDGDVKGGHAWLLVGYGTRAEILAALGVDVAADAHDDTTPYFLMLNSWGDWGPFHGFALIAASDVERLVFAEDGEAWAAVEAPLAA